MSWRMGGRSTHGICMGVLSWVIQTGVVDGVDVAGRPVALALRYSDDEPRSPWTYVLYLDECGPTSSVRRSKASSPAGSEATPNPTSRGLEAEQPDRGQTGRHRRSANAQAPAPPDPRPRRGP